MGTQLEQRQSQRAVLAPQLRQGLRLLSMNLADLREEVAAEMAKNPVIDDARSFLSKFPSSRTAPADREANERRQKFFENQVEEETLERHLMAQLPSSEIAAEDYPLAERLIGDLDDDGRFAGSIPDLVMVMGVSEAKVRSVLAQIRDFDPPGCGATTVGECLEAQLDKIADRGLRARVARLVRNLTDVAAGKVDDPEALRALRTLDPRPGRAYRRDPRENLFVRPEIHAVKCKDGWSARVDARDLPEIHISSKYLAMLSDPDVDQETKAYVRERIAAAKAIVEAVERRQETIADIAQEIFDRQPDFFVRGLKGIVPMTMQSVADKLGVNVSTVSRTVRGKYASTPQGVVELRRFFASGVKSDSGETVLRDAVLDRLRALVDSEDKACPLSDERLAARLKEEGFPLARRTVAKYRALAHVPDVAARRRPMKISPENRK